MNFSILSWGFLIVEGLWTMNSWYVFLNLFLCIILWVLGEHETFVALQCPCFWNAGQHGQWARRGFINSGLPKISIQGRINSGPLKRDHISRMELESSPKEPRVITVTSTCCTLYCEAPLVGLFCPAGRLEWRFKGQPHGQTCGGKDAGLI
jgi:hypothetical protein